VRLVLDHFFRPEILCGVSQQLSDLPTCHGLGTPSLAGEEQTPKTTHSRTQRSDMSKLISPQRSGLPSKSQARPLWTRPKLRAAAIGDAQPIRWATNRSMKEWYSVQLHCGSSTAAGKETYRMGSRSDCCARSVKYMATEVNSGQHGGRSHKIEPPTRHPRSNRCTDRTQKGFVVGPIAALGSFQP
jgi:hypothetical protein